jgi:hypothetical protein
MDIKSILQSQMAGAPSAIHPLYASRPAVTYDTASQQLIYSQNGNVAKVKVPIGRTVSATGSLLTTDESTVTLVDTSLGGITLTLPAGTTNDTYYLVDSAAKWGTNNVTLASNKFFGTTQVYTLKFNAGLARLVYVSAAVGWVVDLSATPSAPTKGTANPLMSNSLPSAGSSTSYSSEDHVHPTDTTRAPVANPAFTGTATLNGATMVAAIHQVDTYTAPGTYTWTKPANAKLVDVYICSAGGGGASGSKGTGAIALSGGASGSGGRIEHYQFLAGQLSATASIVINAGGAGGAAVSTASTNGNAGSNGGGSSFTSGSISVRADTVSGGGVGTWSGTQGVAGTGNSKVGSNGPSLIGNAPSTSGGVNAISATGPSLTANLTTDYPTGMVLPGLVGGSISNTAAALTPAVNRTAHSASSTLTTSTAAGADGSGLQIGNYFFSFGGAGGAASITSGVAAQAGGNGIYGSGGGGGGAALDLAGNSGAGGRGGDGWSVVVTTF